MLLQLYWKTNPKFTSVFCARCGLQDLCMGMWHNQRSCWLRLHLVVIVWSLWRSHRIFNTYTVGNSYKSHRLFFLRSPMKSGDWRRWEYCCIAEDFLHTCACVHAYRASVFSPSRRLKICPVTYAGGKSGTRIKVFECSNVLIMPSWYLSTHARSVTGSPPAFLWRDHNFIRALNKWWHHLLFYLVLRYVHKRGKWNHETTPSNLCMGTFCFTLWPYVPNWGKFKLVEHALDWNYPPDLYLITS